MGEGGGVSCGEGSGAGGSRADARRADGEGADAGSRAARERAGYRIGPVVFVPAIRRVADDPWAHRKGEPRLFALLWAVYLMAGSLLTIFAGRGIGSSSARQLEFASLGFLTIAGFGAAVLFPMVRLSQASPERVVRSLMVDWLVVCAPLVVVVPWLPLLTRWPFEVSLAATAQVCGWALAGAGLAGVGLALCSRRGGVGGGAARAWAMAAVVLMVGGGPMADAAWHAVDASGLPRWWSLSSPLTGPWVLSASEAENLLPLVRGWDWLIVFVPWLWGGWGFWVRW